MIPVGVTGVTGLAPNFPELLPRLKRPMSDPRLRLLAVGGIRVRRRARAVAPPSEWTERKEQREGAPSKVVKRTKFETQEERWFGKHSSPRPAALPYHAPALPF